VAERCGNVPLSSYLRKFTALFPGQGTLANKRTKLNKVRK